MADFILLRDKNIADYRGWVKEFLAQNINDLNAAKIIIHNDLELAIKLSLSGGADIENIKQDAISVATAAKSGDGVKQNLAKISGIHFSSDKISLLSKTPKNLLKIASTHNFSEIKMACELNADFITFSPIFATPNKGEPKGLNALKSACEFAAKINANTKIIALGGIINKAQTAQIAHLMQSGDGVKSCFNLAGFASIRYFF